MNYWSHIVQSFHKSCILYEHSILRCNYLKYLEALHILSISCHFSWKNILVHLVLKLIINLKYLSELTYLINECRLSHSVWSSLGNSISLQQNQFLLGTQAFTSPPDMASSGVWENIILTKTSTFEGVCRMLYFIIFLNFLPNVWNLLTDGKSTFCCWQMVGQLSIDVYDRCYCHIAILPLKTKH